MEEFEKIKIDYYGRHPNNFLAGETHGSDISYHLPTLEKFAAECSHVTEFGMRDGFSTVAFLAGCKGQVVSYDIQPTPMSRHLADIQIPCSWRFTQADTGSPDLEIEETDFLFFDTLHTYEHLKKELRHARKARKLLGFHDTYACGEFDLSGPNPRARGILPAIEEFLSQHPGYRTAHRTDANNGLWVLERVTS